MKSKILPIIIALILLNACSENDFPGIGITIKNDSEDKSFNIVVVSGSSNGHSYYKSLKPGDKLNISGGSPAELKFSRQYAEYVREYKIECPTRTKRFTVKLIDVHLNRIAGGCKTVWANKG